MKIKSSQNKLKQKYYFWDVAKAVLKGKFIVINAYIYVYI